MDPDDLTPEGLRRNMRKTVGEMLGAWRALPGLIASGRVIPERGGWHRFVDRDAFEQVGALGTEFAITADGEQRRMKLSRPDRKTIRIAEKLGLDTSGIDL